MADLLSGPGPAWIAPEPRCPVHGQMVPCTCAGDHHGSTVWVCAGYDGEGCDHVAVRELVPLGRARPMRIRMDYPGEYAPESLMTPWMETHG